MKLIHFFLLLMMFTRAYSQQSDARCSTDSLGVCINPDTEPVFNSGLDSLMKTLRLIPFLELKKRYNLEGTEFIIELIVNEIGVAQITDIRPKKSSVQDLPKIEWAEVVPLNIRYIKDWKPAYCLGKPVTSYVIVSIRICIGE